MAAASHARKTAATASGRARSREPEGDSVVYDGNRIMCDIKRRGDGFVARDAKGRKIGAAFATSREAMKAICAADRAEREAEIASA
jgi:hypothetical protein